MEIVQTENQDDDLTAIFSAPIDKVNIQERLSDLLKGKIIVIFGGTGSWGSELIRQLISDYDPKEIRVFSRGEHSQVALRSRYMKATNIKYIIGDVRDSSRVGMAITGANIVFNLAALKHVPVCEENVWEAIQTNVIGAQNIVEACLEAGVEVAVQVSTDKAVDPFNLYGFTKGCAEKLFTSANNSPIRKQNSKFVCVRGGNVLSTNGSVVPLFKTLIQKFNKVTITDAKMSRYLMRVEEAIKLVLKASVEAIGGEIYVMKMPGCQIVDLAQVLIDKVGNQDTKIENIGIRPGEKLYEVLISKNESHRAVEDGDYFVILPDFYHRSFDREKYSKNQKVEEGEYNSKNTKQLNQEEILKLLEDDGWITKEK